MALAITSFAVDELSTYHRNPRRGDVAAIAASLAARGQYRAIAVNVGTHTGRPLEVLAGNHTLRAARELGWTHIDGTTVDVDDAEAARIVAADNRLADLGSYDDSDLLAVLDLAGDLTGTGYTDADIASLQLALDEPVALTDPDDAPPLPEATPVSRPFDVWELGPHRLYVGSSGDTDAVLAAMPAPADCIWTDPPYGVNYVGGTGLTIKNDGRAEAAQVFRDAIPTMLAIARPGAPIYVAHADSIRPDFQRALEDADITVRQTLIWVKDALVLGRADYHWKHEPILEAALAAETDHEPVAYGFVPGGEGRLGRGGDRWFGDNRQTTVFEVPRPKASRLHPTMKPVELVERMLRNSCAPGALVADLFAGSGSTLLAAHRAGMIAMLCELDPAYADVICERWEAHTGISPVRDGETVSFSGR
ncbi:DNA modification methylase [Leucobacter allii]|uniref:DNA modification methylase n=1 Tax=Leucobacter allii TaxID=2932247 RepID=A0ABY4FQL4_9MICO|nr:DNA modification methylase [Leucobacter allii]UOQ58567.1 DNA modification methylase [Leucobacter allii]